MEKTLLQADYAVMNSLKNVMCIAYRIHNIRKIKIHYWSTIGIYFDP